MSKKSRTLKRARAELSADPAVVKMRSPGDIVCMIPYTLGFQPDDSLVVVSLVGPRQRFGPSLRLDLPDPDDAGLVADIALGQVDQHHFDAVVAVVYSDDIERSGAVMVALLAGLSARGVTVVEAVRADGSRWWSYTCAQPCCPAEGTAYDPMTSPTAARAVAAGMDKATSRDALRAQVAPAGPEQRAAVGAACAALLADQADGTVAPWTPSRVRRTIAKALGQGDDLDVETIAQLLALVQSIELRDVAWAEMSRPRAREHARLWMQVTRFAPDELLPPAGSLAGFAAWLSGRGVLASHAADRVIEVDPGYSMADLLRETLDRGMNPDVWDSTRARIFAVS